MTTNTGESEPQPLETPAIRRKWGKFHAETSHQEDYCQNIHRHLAHFIASLTEGGNMAEMRSFSQFFITLEDSTSRNALHLIRKAIERTRRPQAE
ncbi:hypothetical protein J7382_16900 [Shimia sp. R11_0]|uniref:hypothetical protein n=1 Tax=Shimia sp. R11_0 TaxID=2821096 RepID=UPI001AD9F075|nr:hypothetical protein [Shimia sp. R11_0]MBO9479226.1 hypothetical protein [Shimia sp. R11_0]